MSARVPARQPAITPAGIAAGKGDAFLIALNRAVAGFGGRVYLRPLAEMNGHWNVYSAFNQNGSPRGPAYSTATFRKAFARISVIVHGGPGGLLAGPAVESGALDRHLCSEARLGANVQPGELPPGPRLPPAARSPSPLRPRSGAGPPRPTTPPTHDAAAMPGQSTTRPTARAPTTIPPPHGHPTSSPPARRDRREPADDADQGFEINNNGATETATPHTSAIVANATAIGAGTTGGIAGLGSESDVGVLFREGSNWRLFNNIVTGFRRFRPSMLGKINTTVQIIAIGTIMFAASVPYGTGSYLPTVYATVFSFAVLSGAHYVFFVSKLVNEDRRHDENTLKES